MEHDQDGRSAAPDSMVWLLSCEGPEDECGQTDPGRAALLGVYSSEREAREAERTARGDPELQTYVDGYEINGVNWETEFTVQ